MALPCPSAAKCVVTYIDNDMRDIANSAED